VTTSTSAPRRIEYVPLGEVVPAERNPRLHQSIDKVKGSIRRFGFVEGAVHDGRTGRIIAGHGRTEALAAMRDAGEPTPEGIIQHESGEWLMPLQYGWSSRDDQEAEALLVALNRLTETGGWATAELASLLDELRTDAPEAFDLTGFDSQDVDGMLAELAQDDYDDLPEPGDLDDAPEAPAQEDAISRPGDVWVIGRHRLAVGDSTDLAVVRRALGGDDVRAQLVFTDPPYGVSYKGQNGMAIINDNLSASDLGKLLLGAFRVMKETLIPGGTFYVCAPSGRLETTFRVALEDVGLELRQQLVWVKDSLVLSRADYHGQHETMLYGWQLEGEPLVPPHFDGEHDTMLYGWKDGAAHTFEGGRKQTTVWLFPKPKRSDLHPTMKPVALCRRAVVNSSLPGEARGRVLDLFGGSGTTMVACQTSERHASLVELDPPYADVIVQRMLDLFGLDGVRESDGAKWSGLAAGRQVGRNQK
jgi:DNA modification methylase